MLILVSNASSFDSLITLVWSSDLLCLKMITMENAKETDNADIFTLLSNIGSSTQTWRRQWLRPTSSKAFFDNKTTMSREIGRLLQFRAFKMAKKDHDDKQFQLLTNVSQPPEIFLSQNQCFISQITLKNNYQRIRICVRYLFGLLRSHW